ncbi:hypothetical protein KKH39_04770 [Patescibacteria group bacterium]|nr:hypothetical protein [Patescibacteria group bacterium]
MKFSKTKKVFILFLFFMAAGLIIVLVTHESGQVFNNKIENLPPLVSVEDYAEHIRPWLTRISQDPSLENISQTKQDLLDFRSNNKDIGQVHIKLFLAIDAWENYLLTNQVQMKTLAQENLLEISTALPQLSVEIENLRNILSNV